MNFVSTDLLKDKKKQRDKQRDFCCFLPSFPLALNSEKCPFPSVRAITAALPAHSHKTDCTILPPHDTYIYSLQYLQAFKMTPFNGFLKYTALNPQKRFMFEHCRFVWKYLLLISSKWTFWGLPQYILFLSRNGNFTDTPQLTGKERMFCQNNTFFWELRI